MEQIFRFSKSLCDWTGDAAAAKKLLGGKGAGLVIMAQNEMPVPPGFTITTAVCNQIAKLDGAAREAFLDGLMDEVVGKTDWLHEQFGYMPLVSVRSGAPVSMPGMMDTILNVGLTDATVTAWEKRIGERAAWDSYRRLIQMLGGTAFDVPHAGFEKILSAHRDGAGVATDAELDTDALKGIVEEFKKLFQAVAQQPFPQDRKEQLRAAVKAVFDSWMNERAVIYRQMEKIDDKMGTAVTVQAMVFGNMGEESGTGVLFSRNPSTGAKKVMGEFLQNAQGEDVVAGIRTPVDLDKMPHLDGVWPEVHGLLMVLSHTLEQTYRDMVDVEFTVQQGQLFILQSRTGKRTAPAAFKIAVDLVEECVIDRPAALSRLNAQQFKLARQPLIAPSFKQAPDYVGLEACPGVVTGKPVFSAKDAVNCKEPCILVSHETTPDDIAGMAAAVGILTQTGGATSHAAVVARGMNKTCVVGCTALNIAALKGVAKITIDGSTGNVWVGTDVPVIDASDSPELKTVTEWCMNVLGACEIAAVDLGMDKPHTVMAAFWWGNADVLHAVLDGIAELPSRQHVTLDLRAPKALVPAEDALLADCFGQVSMSDAFAAEIRGVLKKRAVELKGLSLSGAEEALYQLGYVRAGAGLQMVPAAVPGDYAAFSVLGR